MRRDDQYDDNYGNDAAGWSTFLAGAFLGAGLALLFAPRTGSELRGMLRDYASRATDDLVERGREALDTAIERGKDYIERGQEAVQETGRAAREYARSGQEKLKDVGKETVAQFKNMGQEASNRT